MPSLGPVSRNYYVRLRLRPLANRPQKISASSAAEVAAKTPLASVPSAPASAYVIQSDGSAFADWMTIGPP